MRLVAEENWGARREVTVTDTDAKKVKKVTTAAGGEGEGERKGAWSVLDVSCDLVVAQFSSPNTPPQLVRSTNNHIMRNLIIFSMCCVVHWSTA